MESFRHLLDHIDHVPDSIVIGIIILIILVLADDQAQKDKRRKL